MLGRAIVPSVPPPPGTESNFSDPESIGTHFIVVSSVFLSLAVVSVALRVYSRAMVVRSFGKDDWFMLCALLFSIILVGVSLLQVRYGLGRHMWDVPLDWLSPKYLSLDFVASVAYCLGMGFTKVSILLFYLRIFPGRKFFIWTSVVILFAAGYNIASFFAVIFACTPVAKSWDVAIVTGSCINRPVGYLCNAGLGILTDFMIFFLPLPMLWKLSRPRKEKISLALVLVAGGSVCILGIIRPKAVSTLIQSTDLTWNTTSGMMWSIIEFNMGIISGSVPGMKPLVCRYLPAILSRGPSNNFGDNRDYLRRGRYGFGPPAHAHNLGQDSLSLKRSGGGFGKVNTITVTSSTDDNGDSGEDVPFGRLQPGPDSTAAIVRLVKYRVGEHQEGAMPKPREVV